MKRYIKSSAQIINIADLSEAEINEFANKLQTKLWEILDEFTEWIYSADFNHYHEGDSDLILHAILRNDDNRTVRSEQDFAYPLNVLSYTDIKADINYIAYPIGEWIQENDCFRDTRFYRLDDRAIPASITWDRISKDHHQPQRTPEAVKTNAKLEKKISNTIGKDKAILCDKDSNWPSYMIVFDESPTQYLLNIMTIHAIESGDVMEVSKAIHGEHHVWQEKDEVFSRIAQPVKIKDLADLWFQTKEAREAKKAKARAARNY